MDAATLNCPNCGAATAPAATQCAFCRARLATVACPSCFGLLFVGSRHCSHCGARADRGTPLDAPARRCPRCREDARRTTIGDTELCECGRCGGLWLEAETFQRLCADRERQAAVLAVLASTAAPAQAARPHRGPAADPVRYLPCLECGKVMNRLNFARSSGIVLDVCKHHGVWFDEHELRRVVEFIAAGGLDTARAKERAALAEERRRLEFRQALGVPSPLQPRDDNVPDANVSGAFVSFLSLFVS
jgi:Zn-finger nucleic acid-binding protein